MKKASKLKTKAATNINAKTVPDSNTFVTELRQEVHKIEWPTRDASIKAFVTILVIVVGFTSFVAFSDAILSKLIILLRGL